MLMYVGGTLAKRTMASCIAWFLERNHLNVCILHVCHLINVRSERDTLADRHTMTTITLTHMRAEG